MAEAVRRMVPDYGDLKEPVFDPAIQSLVVRHVGDIWVSVTPMLFTDRVLMWREIDYPSGYEAGWCFEKGAAAVMAAMVWDPTEEWEPPGYKKAAQPRRQW